MATGSSPRTTRTIRARGRLITFPEKLKALGPNDQARGQALGLSRRCVQAYSQGEFPHGLEQLMLSPDLLRALADDADRILLENAEQIADQANPESNADSTTSDSAQDGSLTESPETEQPVLAVQDSPVDPT